MSHAEDEPPRVISERKRAANRANARKSTGPRTAAGKARVGLNALTHGMTAHACVLPFENADHFEKFAAALRADLGPVGFLQALMAERLVELAWKLRRAAKAQCRHAGNRLGDDIETTRAMRRAGAWEGPDVSPTGTDMLLDAAEGDREAQPFLRLDLYADRCQRAFQLGLAALRREQRRREERVGPDAEGAVEADVAVELGEDPAEDAHFASKATAGGEDPPEPEDLTRYIRTASAEAIKEVAAPYLSASSQNKATAGATEPRVRGNEAAEKRAPEPAPEARYDAPVEPRPTQPAQRAPGGPVVPADDATGPDRTGVDGGRGDAGAARRPAHDPPGPAAVPVVGVQEPDDGERVDCSCIGLRGWRPGHAPGGIFRTPAAPAPGPAPGT
jgi:hypothetical protein